jgi:hypothetical protein
MTATYDKIATQTLGSSAATVTFSSIGATYTDLVLIVSATQTPATSANSGFIQLNSDTGSNYSLTNIYGNGSAAGSGRYTSATSMTNMIFQNVVGTTIMQFQNYSNTTTNKTVLTRANMSSGAVEASVGLWRSTTAINRIDLKLNASQSFATGSTFTLYGIKAE